jgi:cytochrome P450
MEFIEIAEPALVREALAHPALRVRPPGEPVPAALQGRPTGEVFALLVRMNDGEFHRRHRPEVERALQGWTRERVAAASRAAAHDLLLRHGANEVLALLPVQAVARLLDVPAGALDATARQVLDFTRGIAPGADEAALDASDRAAVALMAQGEAQGLARAAAANRIALMQQSADATSGLIGLRLLGEEGLPVVQTRRFAADDLELGGRALHVGQGLVLSIAQAGCGFGAGVHACPGEAVALALAEGAVPVLAASGRFTRCVGYRPLPNVRIPIFQE